MEESEVVPRKEDLCQGYVAQEVDGDAIELLVGHVSVKVALVILGQIGRPYSAVALIDVNAHAKGLAPPKEVTNRFKRKRVALQGARVIHAVDGSAVVRDHVGAVEKVCRNGREALDHRRVRPPRRRHKEHAQLAHAPNGFDVCLGDAVVVREKGLVHIACNQPVHARLLTRGNTATAANAAPATFSHSKVRARPLTRRQPVPHQH